MITLIEKEINYSDFIDLQERNNIFSKNTKERFEWIFYNNPYGNTLFYCAFDEDKLIGLEALIPLKMAVNDDEFMTAIAVCSLVDDNYRGQGIWKKLLFFSQEEAKKKNIKVIWGSPGENSRPILLKSTNWILLDSLYYYYFRLKANKNTSFIKKNLQIVFCSLMKIKIKLEKQNFKLCEFVRVAPPTTNKDLKIIKDDVYINWRYKSIPDPGYIIKSIENVNSHEIVGYLVYKLFLNSLYLLDYKIKDDESKLDFIRLLKCTGYNNKCDNVILSLSSKNKDVNFFKENYFNQQQNEHLLMANILDKDYNQLFTTAVWDLSIGDEDAKYTLPFEI